MPRRATGWMVSAVLLGAESQMYDCECVPATNQQAPDSTG